MSDYFPADQEDLIFFHKAMKDVKPLKKAFPSPSKKSLQIKQNKPPKEEFYHPISSICLSDPAENTITAEDKLFFRRPGPQDKIIKKLIKGQVFPSVCLDLHNMTIHQARIAVSELLHVSQKSEFRCIKIIHGKGQSSRTEATLKNHVNYWLQQVPQVLAFSSAPPQSGGRGAVYVLLSRSAL